MKKTAKNWVAAFLVCIILWGGVVPVLANTGNADTQTSYTKRLYSKILGRNGQKDEVSWYVDLLNNGQLTADQMAYDFLNSEEFSKRKVSNQQYVEILYQAILNRKGSEGEIRPYTNQLNEGASRNGILHYFITSDEFKNNCNDAGLVLGGVKMSTYDSNPDTARLVTKLYRQIFGRVPSVEEVSWRVGLIAGGMSVAQTVYDMMTSTEFENKYKNKDDSGFVGLLYAGILGRSANASEIKHHVESISIGANRSYLLSTFIYSEEFSNRVAAYGLNVGTANIAGIEYPGTKNPGGSNSSKPSTGSEKITIKSGGSSVTDTLENILIRTVYAEVGGLKNAEVYKAQAVAAYTYILYYQQDGKTADLPLATPPSSVSGMISSAVNEVMGTYVSYSNKPALTTYYAISNGSTNPSGDIWSKSFPYLTTVKSKYDSSASGYQVKKTISLDQFHAIMEKTYGSSSAYSKNGDPSTWIKLTKNSAGYVTAINVCGRTPSVEYFYQKMFGLRSPDFTITYNSSNKTFTFVTKGFGHGVGMSQMGAYYYAMNDGWSYKQILSHYYPGTTLAK